MNKVGGVMIIFILFGCNVSKQYQTDMVINGVVEYVKLVDTIGMRILFYSAGCECNETTVCASECIGLTDNGDTLRVLSLCNTATNFAPNMKIKVAPQSKPKDIDTLIIPNVWVERNRHFYVHEIYRQRLKTAYGELISINSY